MMRKTFAVLVMACILVTGCGSAKAEQTTPAQAEQVAVEATTEQAATTAEQAAVEATTEQAATTAAEASTDETATPATATVETYTKHFTNVTIKIVLNKRTLRVIFDEGNGEEFLEQELDEAEYHEALNRLHDETKREAWFQQLHTIR